MVSRSPDSSHKYTSLKATAHRNPKHQAMHKGLGALARVSGDGERLHAQLKMLQH